jgi:hypothetical protein
MKYKKFNKYELKEIRRQKLEKIFEGSGRYLFQNNTSGSLEFPARPQSKIKTIQKGEIFEGDSYYLQYVRTNELKQLEVLEEPNKKESVMPDKLILDQPDTITEQGKVEHVVQGSPVQPLRESEKAEETKEVLLNERPVDDGFMIVE